MRSQCACSWREQRHQRAVEREGGYWQTRSWTSTAIIFVLSPRRNGANCRIWGVAGKATVMVGRGRWQTVRLRGQSEMQSWISMWWLRFLTFKINPQIYEACWVSALILKKKNPFHSWVVVLHMNLQENTERRKPIVTCGWPRLWFSGISVLHQGESNRTWGTGCA